MSSHPLIPIEGAAKIAGNQSKLATLLDTSPRWVSGWKSTRNNLPELYAWRFQAIYPDWKERIRKLKEEEARRD